MKKTTVYWFCIMATTYTIVFTISGIINIQMTTYQTIVDQLPNHQMEETKVEKVCMNDSVHLAYQDYLKLAFSQGAGHTFITKQGEIRHLFRHLNGNIYFADQPLSGTENAPQLASEQNMVEKFDQESRTLFTTKKVSETRIICLLVILLFLLGVAFISRPKN